MDLIPICRRCLGWPWSRNDEFHADATCRLGYCRECHGHGFVVRLPEARLRSVLR